MNERKRLELILLLKLVVDQQKHILSLLEKDACRGGRE
jgi:hypothetical protein